MYVVVFEGCIVHEQLIACHIYSCVQYALFKLGSLPVSKLNCCYVKLYVQYVHVFVVSSTIGHDRSCNVGTLGGTSFSVQICCWLFSP
jgi:hypothetical protein